MLRPTSGIEIESRGRHEPTLINLHSIAEKWAKNVEKQYVPQVYKEAEIQAIPLVILMDLVQLPNEVRNKKLLPDLRKEGELSKEIVLTTTEKHGAPVGSRLFSHHTLASVRKLSFFHPYFLPEDSLDIVLTATYNHSTEKFADKEDLYIQPETIGCPTWRRLRNTQDKIPPVKIPLGHPMKRGGIVERKSPFSVKLMNSGVHSSQTNPGYSRQPAGGAIFFY